MAMATRSHRLTVSKEHEGRAEPRQGPGDVVAAVLEGSRNEQEAMSRGAEAGSSLRHRSTSQPQNHADGKRNLYVRLDG